MVSIFSLYVFISKTLDLCPCLTASGAEKGREVHGDGELGQALPGRAGHPLASLGMASTASLLLSL